MTTTIPEPDFITEDELKQAILTPLRSGNKITEFTQLTNKVRDRIKSRNISGGPQRMFQSIQTGIMQQIVIIKTTHSEDERRDMITKCTAGINAAYRVLKQTLEM